MGHALIYINMRNFYEFLQEHDPQLLTFLEDAAEKEVVAKRQEVAAKTREVKAKNAEARAAREEAGAKAKEAKAKAAQITER